MSGGLLRGAHMHVLTHGITEITKSSEPVQIPGEAKKKKSLSSA